MVQLSRDSTNTTGYIASKMADHAPGYEQAAEDLQCYNCGMRGHMFFACPEDTRRVPAGLEASRKRQASANDHHASTKRRKGPIVTHYPPPPLGLQHISPPPPTHSPRPGYERFHVGLSPGPPTRQPHHQPPHPGQHGQYPPPSTGPGASQGFSYSNSSDVYEHYYSGAPQIPPPETPYRPPQYDQYDQYRPGPSPPVSYGRRYSTPLDQHDEHPTGPPQSSPYVITYRTPLQPHFEYYHPAPGADNYSTGPPPPYPPPPSDVYRNSTYYGHDDASPARLSTIGHGSPPLGTAPYQSLQHPPLEPSQYHSRYDERYADQHSTQTQRRETHSQRAKRRSNESRQNSGRHGRRMRYDSSKGRSHSERQLPDRLDRFSSPVTSTPSVQSARNSTVPDNKQSQQNFVDSVSADTKNTGKYIAEDFSWDEEMIFKELPVKITRDLIKEPLPVEWTDEPIMPPKYDKETITSKYINSTNVDDFALSVRETKAWQFMQYHPAFLSPHEIRTEKLEYYTRALNPTPAYTKQNRQGVNNSSAGNRPRGKSWGIRGHGASQSRYPQHHQQNHTSSDYQSSPSRAGPAKRSWEPADYRDSYEPEEEDQIFAKKPRISSPEPGEVCETDDRPTSTAKSISPPWEQEYHVYHHGHATGALPESRAKPSDIRSESGGRRLSVQASPTPPPAPSRISGAPSRLSSRSSSRGRPTRPRSKHSSRSTPSRPTSRRSSAGSPLTPTERELLGYSSSSDSERESPLPQVVNGTPTRSRQRPAKLHAVYQRRW
ncbi:hypothetical protein F5Y14DRAFT_169083 [Nemania sp. NC0429]|nr:hypothetical protein F5Y14DRAFT_169083 [Nemania sp. NC0429]